MTDKVDWREVVGEMESRFTSLNDIPVSRAGIKREEWDAVLEEIKQLDADAAGLKAELESYKYLVSSTLDDCAIRDDVIQRLEKELETVKGCWTEALANVSARNRQIERLERERAAAIDRLLPLGLEIERLRAVLLESKRSHVVCEDCWYSCPASGECCKNDHGGKCDCGADEWNAKVDAALLNATPGAIISGENSVTHSAEFSRPQGLQLIEQLEALMSPPENWTHYNEGYNFGLKRAIELIRAAK